MKDTWKFKPVGIGLPDDMREEIMEIARQNTGSLSQAIRMLLTEALAARAKKEKKG